jgi:transcriptional regulator with XRE-family HTH domain
MGMERPLVQRLKAQKGSDGESQTKLAKRLGISKSYLSELLNGTKDIAVANDQLVREIASYLNIQVVMAFVLAGKLRSEDIGQTKNFNIQLRELLVNNESQSVDFTAAAVKLLILQHLNNAFS